ncbi:MAG TPA: chorismate-binding protein, partial [Candidatus Caenarcaniphilales bacterium]
MIFPDFSQFSALAQQGNFIPVYQEWIADLDTPVSAWYRVCAGESYSFLLESVEGGEQLARYSFLGCDPVWVLETRDEQTTQTHRDGSVIEFTGDPFQILADCLKPYKPVKLPQLPPGIGGLFGFWGYELIQWIETRVPVFKASATDLPDGLWMQVDNLLIFDQVKRKIWAIAYADLQATQGDVAQAYQDACDRVTQLVNKLQLPLEQQQTRLSWNPTPAKHDFTYTSNTTREQFCAQVKKAKAHIQAGDIFQVVLSQRLSTTYQGDPFRLYRSLRLINP